MPRRDPGGYVGAPPSRAARVVRFHSAAPVFPTPGSAQYRQQPFADPRHLVVAVRAAVDQPPRLLEVAGIDRGDDVGELEELQRDQRPRLARGEVRVADEVEAEQRAEAGVIALAGQLQVAAPAIEIPLLARIGGVAHAAAISAAGDLDRIAHRRRAY